MADVQSLLVANEKLSQEVLRPGADQIDQSRRFPRENIAVLGKAGVLGLLVPAQFGGPGASLGEMSRVLDTQSQACASTAMVTLMHYCATAVIAAKGGDRLKQELLPSFARAGHLSTLAFSEYGSGGHFYAPVSEVREKRLSASKSFVTSADEADSYVVSARKTGAAGPTESNLYLIFKGASGLAAQGRFEGLGLAGNASAPMTLTDVSIDDETRIGSEVPSSPGSTACSFHPFHRLRRAGSVPGVADCDLHRRLRATGTLSGGRRRARAAGGGRKPGRISWRLHHRLLEVARLFSWQALYQPRRRWADHARDVGAFSPGCD